MPYSKRGLTHLSPFRLRLRAIRFLFPFEGWTVRLCFPKTYSARTWGHAHSCQNKQTEMRTLAAQRIVLKLPCCTCTLVLSQPKSLRACLISKRRPCGVGGRTQAFWACPDIWRSFCSRFFPTESSNPAGTPQKTHEPLRGHFSLSSSPCILRNKAWR